MIFLGIIKYCWYNPEIILGINSLANNLTLSCQNTRNNPGLYQVYSNNLRFIPGIILVFGGVQTSHYRKMTVFPSQAEIP